MVIKKIKFLRCPIIEVNSSIRDSSCYFPPLALASITSYLMKKGFIIDQDDLHQKVYSNKISLDMLKNYKCIINFIKGKKERKIEKFLKKIMNLTNLKGFDIYFISIASTISAQDVLSLFLLCKYLKEKYKKPILVGGSSFHREIFEFNSKFKLFDYAIRGSGEIPSYKLLSALNKNKSLNNIKGLAYWKDRKFVQNKGEYPMPLIKPDFKGLLLDNYTWETPNWILKYIKDYKVEKKKILILPILFIVGCPHNCAFCFSSCHKYLKFLEPSKVVNILKELKEEYKTKHFIFFSNTLNISKRYINEFCDEIIKNKLEIYWSDSFYPSNLDKGTIIKMKKAGCIQACIGLETGSQRLLKYIKRSQNLDECSKIIKEAHSNGIWTDVNIISGLPTETEKNLMQTISFLKKNQKHINKLHVSPFCLRKNCDMFRNPKEYGLKNIKRFQNSSKYPFTSIQKPYCFDEEAGLKWEDKLKQTFDYKNRIQSKFPYDLSCSFLEELPLKHFMYGAIKNKREREKVMTKIIKTFNKIYLYKYPLRSLNKLFGCRNIKEIINKIKKCARLTSL